jgi:hypothetical protein
VRPDGTTPKPTVIPPARCAAHPLGGSQPNQSTSAPTSTSSSGIGLRLAAGDGLLIQSYAKAGRYVDHGVGVAAGGD